VSAKRRNSQSRKAIFKRLHDITIFRHKSKKHKGIPISAKADLSLWHSTVTFEVMKLAVLGAGKMGRAIAYDFCRQKDVKQVTLLEENQRTLKEAAAFIKSPKLKAIPADLSSAKKISQKIKGHTAVASAIPYFLNLDATKAAIQAKSHFVDLGGNDTVVAQQEKLNRQAQKSGVGIIPDTGLAPGMANILAFGAISQFDSVENLHIRVGGLPLQPRPPFNYQEVFALDGLINEYVEPARILKDGRLAIVESLQGIEPIDFPEPFGKLEAFYTSGGAAALPDLLQGKVKNLDYKTIRYPGHCQKMRAFFELGLASQKEMAVGKARVTPRAVWMKLLSNVLPKTGPDAVLIRIWLDGFKAGKKMRLTYEMIDQADPKFTAMMKTTAFPASIIALLLARKEIPQTGVLRQEEAVPKQKFIAELEARGLHIDSKLEEI